MNPSSRISIFIQHFHYYLCLYEVLGCGESVGRAELGRGGENWVQVGERLAEAQHGASQDYIGKIADLSRPIAGTRTLLDMAKVNQT